jgi:hypothetical protein
LEVVEEVHFRSGRFSFFFSSSVHSLPLYHLFFTTLQRHNSILPATVVLNPPSFVLDRLFGIRNLRNRNNWILASHKRLRYFVSTLFRMLKTSFHKVAKPFVRNAKLPPTSSCDGLAVLPLRSTFQHTTSSYLGTSRIIN